MAADYASGSAASFSDLLTALEAFLTTYGGWSAQAGPAASGDVLAQRILTKGDLVYRFAVNTAEPSFYCTGATGVSGTDTTGDAPFSVKMSSPNLSPITFPVTYELFWNDNPEEVYVVIAYGGNKYQHLNFGQSDQPGLGGTGAWVTGSVRGDYDISSDVNYSKVFMNASVGGHGTDYIQSAPLSGFALGFFFEAASVGYAASMVHHGLDGGGWAYPYSNSVGDLHQPWNTDLLMALPSSYNEAEVLVPIHTTVQRPDSVSSLALSLRHARYMRLDNVTPGQTITYGGEQWKCYPLYSKNVVERNGVGWTTGADHSGTVGVAIRYPGA